MEFYLQFGHGMMEHSRHLIGEWGGGTVILSPRDLDGGQLERLARDINGLDGGRVLLDPQFYVPRSDHHRLTAHDYWPADYDTTAFFSGAQATALLDRLYRLNQDLGTVAFILPGLMASRINDDWLAVQNQIVGGALTRDYDLPLYATVALSADALRDEHGIQEVLEAFEQLDVAGVYVLAEHPDGAYLVSDPIWLGGVLELCAGLRLAGKEVVAGYANHQLLCLGAASVNAICSGTWMNMRAFSPDRYLANDDDEIRRRATWYYSPGSLSECKPLFMDVAHRMGVLNELRVPSGMASTYADPLFSGVQPSSAGFGEREAFRHYLHCLRQQTTSARLPTFDDTLRHHEAMLDAAEALHGRLEASGVRFQQRGFSDAFDVVRSALAMLEATRGPILRRAWSSL